MVRSPRAWRLVLVIGLVGLGVSIVWSFVTVTDVQAQLRASSGSDPRATFARNGHDTSACSVIKPD